MDAHRSHLSRGQDAQDAGRSLHHRFQRAQGHHRRRRMPARTATAYQTLDRRPAQGGKTRGAGQVRCRRRRVYRRPCLHPPVRLPDTHAEGQSGPVTAGSSCNSHRRLCRLRPVRRKRTCGDVVPVVLPRRDDTQSEVARTHHRRAARLDHPPVAESMSLGTRRPVTLLICALGGEGGGVLAEWLVDTARQCGYSAQSTSIPGVAQRTGSTTYYFGVFPVPIAELDGRKPVFSLYPVAGALDVLVSSELLETVRHISNGMASADRTLVITSNSRTLTTAEKIQLADGRAASVEMLKVVKRYSRDTRILDMTAVARETDTVLSAVLFGAIAGSDALPFPRIA